MSAFGFISSSPPLSSLLIEDLYDSQQWGSSASASSRSDNKPVQASYFSILDDLAEQSGSSPKQNTSAFTFMSPSKCKKKKKKLHEKKKVYLHIHAYRICSIEFQQQQQ